MNYLYVFKSILDYLLGSVNVVSSFVLVVVFLILYFLRRHRELFKTTLSVCATWIVVLVLKFLIRRPRPFGKIVYIPLTNVVDYSFPSQHAATSFSLAYALSKFFGHGEIFYSIAFLVSISRVYFGFHYVSDVVAGALIGISVSVLVLDGETFLERWFHQRNLLRKSASTEKIIFCKPNSGNWKLPRIKGPKPFGSE